MIETRYLRGLLCAAGALLLCACASVDGEGTDGSAAVDTDVAAATKTVARAEPAPADAEAADSEGDPNEVICRRERATGSHFSRRVCRTRAQIAAEQAEAQELMRGRTGSAGQPTGAGG